MSFININKINHKHSLLTILLLLLTNSSYAQIITVNSPSQIEAYGLYEITIIHDQSAYSNVWWDVDVSVQFTSPTGKLISVNGFYYDTNIWMVRFSPSEVGNYTWTLSLNEFPFADPIVQIASASGLFESLNSNNKGFIRQHPSNPHRWVHESDGSLYHGIGVTTYTTLHTEHTKINLSQDWDVGGFQMEQLQDRVSLEDYMTVMIDESGFNLWRWGNSNMGYSLWESISTSGNQFSVTNGQYTDRFFKSIRNHTGRIYFDILGGGIQDPTGSLFNYSTDAEKLSTTHYIRYLVARYAALVDFWETSNEQNLPNSLISFLATNLRIYDPYQHLIAASWRKPEHPDVDINAPHWYASFSSGNAASATFDTIENTFEKYTNFTKPDGKIGQKPMIFGEIGQSIVDCQSSFYASVWTPDSSLTTRMKYWASFFAESILVSWDQSKSKEERGGNYFDPELKNYMRAFTNFTQLVKQDVSMDSSFNTNQNTQGISGGHGAKAYGLRSSSNFYAYIFDPTDNFASNIQLSVDVPQPGQAMWYDPETGNVISSLFSVNSGIQTLMVPTIQHDLALFIKGNGSIDTFPDAHAGSDVIINDTDDDGFAAVSLDASNSLDIDGGSIQSWRWSIYGKTIGTHMSINYNFKQGITPVTLSVTDDEGNLSTDFLRVRVNNASGNTPPFLSLKHGLTGDWSSQGSVNMAMYAVSEDIDSNGVNHYLNNTYTWKIDGVTVATNADFWPCGNGNSQYSGLNKTASTSVSYGGHIVTVIADNGNAQSQDSELYIAYEPFTNNNNPSADAGADEILIDFNNDGKESITLSGSGSDTDGSITGFFWYDGKDFIGKGQLFSIELSLGLHNITLITVDNLGAYGDIRKVVTVRTNDLIFINGFD